MNRQSWSTIRTQPTVAYNKLLTWAIFFSLIAAAGCSKRPVTSLPLPHESPLIGQLKTQCGMVNLIQTQIGGAVKTKGVDLFNASPAALRTLGDAQWIEELEFVASDLRTPDFGEIGKLTGLKKLTIINGQFFPEQMAALENLTNLETLELNFTIGEASTESRTKLLGKLSSNEERTAEWLRQEGSGEEIIQMALLTDRAMVVFDKLTQIKKLEMLNTYCSPTGFQHLKSLTNLEEASISPLSLSGDTAAPFQAMTNLRSLRYFNVDDGVMAVLSKLENLEYLNVWSGNVTDASVSKLSNLKKLQRLEIRGNKITDQGLQHLWELPNLSNLDLEGAKNITAKGIAEFAKLQPGVIVSH